MPLDPASPTLMARLDYPEVGRSEGAPRGTLPPEVSLSWFLECLAPWSIGRPLRQMAASFLAQAWQGPQRGRAGWAEGSCWPSRLSSLLLDEDQYANLGQGLGQPLLPLQND